MTPRQSTRAMLLKDALEVRSPAEDTKSPAMRKVFRELRMGPLALARVSRGVRHGDHVLSQHWGWVNVF